MGDNIRSPPFFVSEEIGCQGSRQCNPDFVGDVGYIIEFDSPEGDIMSYSNSGVMLFPENGHFIRKASPLLDKHGVTKWQRHPYTDVRELRPLAKVCALNLPAGYYRFHSRNEYVKVSDVANAVELGLGLIATLGAGVYPYASTKPEWQRQTMPKREVTGLQCSVSNW